MSLTAPFLKSISVISEQRKKDKFPFNILTFLNDTFRLNFETPITFFVGENGSGKSTVLEALAQLCGFHKSGGSHMHQLYHSDDGVVPGLRNTLRPSWLPKVSQGFFFRSESFFNVARYVDTEGDPYKYWGGKQLHGQSHGESFLAAFENQFKTDQKKCSC